MQRKVSRVKARNLSRTELGGLSFYFVMKVVSVTAAAWFLWENVFKKQREAPP